MEAEVSCKHWWVLPPPDGRTALGVCKRCGQIRTFFNSTDEEYGKLSMHKQQPQPIGHIAPTS